MSYSIYVSERTMADQELTHVRAPEQMTIAVIRARDLVNTSFFYKDSTTNDSLFE